jgi:hypothetical protein
MDNRNTVGPEQWRADEKPEMPMGPAVPMEPPVPMGPSTRMDCPMSAGPRVARAWATPQHDRHQASDRKLFVHADFGLT